MMNKNLASLSQLTEKQKKDVVQKLEQASTFRNVKVYEGKVDAVYAIQINGPVSGEPYFKQIRRVYADHEMPSSIQWGTGAVLPDLNANEINTFKQVFPGRCVDVSGGGKKGVFIVENLTQDSRPDKPQSKLAGWVGKALPYAGPAMLAGVMVPCLYATAALFGGSQGFLLNSPNLCSAVFTASGISLGTGVVGGTVGGAIMSVIDPEKDRPSIPKDVPLDFDKQAALETLRQSIGLHIDHASQAAVSQDHQKIWSATKTLDIAGKLAERRQMPVDVSFVSKLGPKN